MLLFLVLSWIAVGILILALVILLFIAIFAYNHIEKGMNIGIGLFIIFWILVAALTGVFNNKKFKQFVFHI